MAKRNKKEKIQKRAAKKAENQGSPPEQPVASVVDYAYDKHFLLILSSILAVTFVALFPSLSNGFVFWDDPEYVTKSPYIKSIDLKEIFSSYYMGNYHPLTLLSYSIEYIFFEFNPFWYHFNNIMLHLANTAMVFFLVFHLLRQQKMMVAVVAAVLFGIHPMHVESVTWVSERKDVLYTFFFLLSSISYLFYRSREETKFLWISLLFFIFSCFSKAQAVTLPVTLLLFDFLHHRKFTKKVVLEKVPFFALSLVFGLVAIAAQKAEAAINPDYSQSFQSLFWGCYGLSVYLIKLVLPINLSGVHPYPFEAGREIPWFVYASPAFVATLAILTIKSLKNSRVVAFGMLYFLVTILPVLKFIPVGDAVIAERYSYIPYIGLFFIAGHLAHFVHSSEKFKKLKPLPLMAGGMILITLGVLTWQRTKVWENSITFWTDVTEKYPNYWRGYHCIGQEHYQAGNYQEAISFYTTAAKVDEYCPPVPYLWRGVVYLEQIHDYDKAITDFKKVISFPNKTDRTQVDARNNMGLAYYRKGDNKNAIQTYNESARLSPNEANIYYLRGLAYVADKQYNKAVADYTRTIQLNPGAVNAYLNRGVVYTDHLSEHKKAIQDFQRVLQLDPTKLDAAVNTGVAKYKMGNYKAALNDFNRVLQSDPNNGRAYYLRALVHVKQNNYRQAVADGQKAKQLGVNISDALLQSWGQRSN